MAVLSKQRVTSLGAATTLTIPAGTKSAIITAAGNSVRYWMDGSVPTATQGHFLGDGGTVQIDRDDGLDVAQFIQVAATATLEVTYLNRRSDEVTR
jgi:hypothetical protein